MSQQYLTFKLAGEEYGVGILSVQEIRGWSGVTAMPNSPPWLLGVLELRGVAVPVIDLRSRFALAPAEFGPSTVIIVLRVSAGNEERTVGLLVDAISEVYDIEASAFRNLPDFGTSATSEMVNGLAHTDGKTVILLDAHRLATNAMAA